VANYSTNHIADQVCGQYSCSGSDLQRPREDLSLWCHMNNYAPDVDQTQEGIVDFRKRDHDRRLTIEADLVDSRLIVRWGRQVQEAAPLRAGGTSRSRLPSAPPGVI